MPATAPPPVTAQPAPGTGLRSAGLTSRHAVTTPEGVTFRRRPAELPSRARAWLIDQCIVIVLKILVLWALAQWGGMEERLVLAFTFMVSLALDFGYHTLFEWLGQGQTPGKKALGLRVVAANGARLDGEGVFLRNLVRAIDGLPAFMFIGGLVSLCEPHRRRLGDLVAGTLVVREPAGAVPATVFDADTTTGAFDQAPELRARLRAQLDREDRDLLLDLALRRDGLEPLARADLFAAAAVHYRQQFSLSVDEHLTDERFVLNLARIACEG